MKEKIDPLSNSGSSPAAIKDISLSQAILAPLDALFKAQVHAARSFLNLLLQVGYPHIELDDKGAPKEGTIVDKAVYTQDFYFEDADGKKMKISIPSLALVPITPLTIDNASFKLDFKVNNTRKHTQIQASENEQLEKENGTDWNTTNRPWYLVKDPVSFVGNVAPSQNIESELSASSSSVINIEINLVRQPLPAGLDKLLTALQQSSFITNF